MDNPTTEDVFIGATKEEFAETTHTPKTIDDITPSEDIMMGFDEKKPANVDKKPKLEDVGEDKKPENIDSHQDDVEENENKSSKSQKKKETDSAQKDEEGESATKSSDKKSEKKKSEGLKISFSGEEEGENEINSKETNSKDTKETTGQLTEVEVLQFLQQDEQFRNIKSLADLQPQTELSEPVAKFKEFHEATGRGIEAYHLATKDWKGEDKDEVIRRHLSLTNPRATEENIEKKLGLLKLTDDEKDSMTEREISKAELEYDEAYGEALNYMQDFSKKFAAPKESVQQGGQQEETPESREKMYGNYWKKRDASLKSINTIDISVDGVGDISVPVSDEDKNIVMENTSTFKGFFKRWQDEKNNTLDTDALTTDSLWAIKPLREKFLGKILEQMHALTIEGLSKKQRKVTIDKPKNMPELHSNEQVVAGLFVDGESDADKKTRRAGTPLI